MTRFYLKSTEGDDVYLWTGQQWELKGTIPVIPKYWTRWSGANKQKQKIEFEWEFPKQNIKIERVYSTEKKQVNTHPKKAKDKLVTIGRKQHIFVENWDSRLAVGYATCIYQKPITREDYEGIGVILEMLRDDGGVLLHCRIQFQHDSPEDSYRRTIYVVEQPFQ